MANLPNTLAVWRISDESIDWHLYQLRAQIIREGREGLPEVDMLLASRGCDPERWKVPAKTKAAGRGKRRRRARG